MDKALSKILEEYRDTKIYNITCQECGIIVVSEYDLSVIPHSPIVDMMIETHLRNRHKYSELPYPVNFSITMESVFIKDKK